MYSYETGRKQKRSADEKRILQKGSQRSIANFCSHDRWDYSSNN
jgi:hypothetical protein